MSAAKPKAYVAPKFAFNQRITFTRKFSAASETESAAADFIKRQSDGRFDVAAASAAYVKYLDWFGRGGHQDLFFWYQRQNVDAPVLLILEVLEDGSWRFHPDQGIRMAGKVFEKVPKGKNQHFGLALTRAGKRFNYSWNGVKYVIAPPTFV